MNTRTTPPWDDLVTWHEQGVTVAEQAARLGVTKRCVSKYRQQLAQQGRIVLGERLGAVCDALGPSVLPLDEDRPPMMFTPYVCALCGVLYKRHLQCCACLKYLGDQHADGDGIEWNGLRYCDTACAKGHRRVA